MWTSKQKEFIVPHTGGTEKFVVHNDEGAYTGSNTLTGATAYSDNSIYAEVGLQVGTHRIARLAHRMGITTPISTNPAMTIGGLKVGVTPLDMAHAYETIAHGGRRVSGTLAEARRAGRHPGSRRRPHARSPTAPIATSTSVETKPVLPPDVAATETSMLETVLQYGTARAAAIGQFAAGKTGTTSNYGDAWFVGWDHKYTVAVWVGYPNRLVPMTTDFNGGPVLGGTFPALIWHDFMTSALQVDKTRAEQAARRRRPRAPPARRPSSRAPARPKKRPRLPAAPLEPRIPAKKAAANDIRARARAVPSEHGASPAPAAPAPSSPPTPAAPSPAESAPAPKGGGGASSEATGGVSASP